MEEITRQGFSENEYQELLQQAVAVINDTRQRVAKQVNGNITSAYWKIGKLLYEKKIRQRRCQTSVYGLESAIPKYGTFHTPNVEHEEVLSALCG